MKCKKCNEDFILIQTTYHHCRSRKERTITQMYSCECGDIKTLFYSGWFDFTIKKIMR